MTIQIFGRDIKVKQSPYTLDTLPENKSWFREIGSGNYQPVSDLEVAVILHCGGRCDNIFYDVGGYVYDLRHYLDGNIELI